MIDPYLRLLLNIAVIMGMLIACFLLVIIILRIGNAAGRQKFESRSRLWEGYFFDYLQDEISLEEAVKLFNRENNYKWLQRFFSAYLDNLEGEDFEKTKTLCREIGLISYFQNKLRHGTKIEKALAAKTLGSMHCRESIPEMVGLLHSNDPLLLYAAAQGLSKSGDADSFFLTAKALLNNTYFTYEGTAELLTGFGEKICPLITRFLQLETTKDSTEDQSVLISILVDIIGYHRYDEAVPQLNELTKVADEETTIHLLKAFLRIGKVPINFDVKSYLQHQNWVIRSFGAQVSNLASDKSALPVLEKMLADQHWWVRFNAARALQKAGTEGLDILKRKAAEEMGAAVDISRYVLNLKEGRS